VLHASPKTTARYAMVAPEKLIGALGALNRVWTRARTNVEKERAGHATGKRERVKSPRMDD
jgi:hypothetical protein